MREELFWTWVQRRTTFSVAQSIHSCWWPLVHFFWAFFFLCFFKFIPQIFVEHLLGFSLYCGTGMWLKRQPDFMGETSAGTQKTWDYSEILFLEWKNIKNSLRSLLFLVFPLEALAGQAEVVAQCHLSWDEKTASWMKNIYIYIWLIFFLLPSSRPLLSCGSALSLEL